MTLLGRRPAKLSGGEKQRVAIGRTLLSSPSLLLMDEPMASLDSSRKAEILPFIGEICREFKLPVLYVSHSPDEVISLAKKLGTYKKAVLDNAIRYHLEKIQAEQGFDILEYICGSWQRHESPAETVESIKETIRRSRERYKR